MRKLPKHPKIIIPVVVVLGLIIYAFIPSSPARFVTQIYSPYQYVIESDIRGTSVDIFRCAMREVRVPFEIVIVPGEKWNAVQAETKNGKYDGFFGALHTLDRDEYAVWSVPVDTNRGYFITRKDSNLKLQDAKIGVKKGSGISKQFQDANIRIAYYAEDNPELVRLLIEKEIDLIYMDIGVFNWALSENKVIDKKINLVSLSEEFDSELFHFRYVADQMYGVYFTKRWLSDKPDFMEQFNAAVSVCRQRRELNIK